jgi:N-acetylmuramoyl-L-alanine amidase
MSKTHIVIHHSLTKDSETVSWGAIRKYHTDPAGPYKMIDIGYHLGIELLRDQYEILFGRMPDRIGAHCKEANMNRIGIGICVVGNFDVEEPPDATIALLDRVVRWLMRTYNIPYQNVIGHREAGLIVGKDWRKGEYKTCPGKLFPLEEFRESLVT